MSKEFEDINLEDYENIEVEMDDIKKAKMKKVLRFKIMDKKKRSKRKIAIAASLSIIMTLGVVSQPAIAQSMPLISTIYQKMGFSEKYLPVTKYVGKSVEENGIKITVENIGASQRVIRLSIKVEAKNDIFKDPTSLIHMSGAVNGIIVGSGGSAYNIDKKNYVQVIELSSNEGFPSTGTLKLDMFSDTYQINQSIELNIDFKDSYKNNIKKEVAMENNNGEYKIVELEGTTMGTFLKVENCNLDESNGGDVRNGILLKVDDKIYYNGSSWSDGKISYISCPNLVYSDIKNSKTISAIEYKKEEGSIKLGGNSSMTKEQLEIQNKLYEEEMRKHSAIEAASIKKEKDNVEYISELTSQDGNKVNITNVERTDGKIKVYISGDERNDVLRVADSMSICDENNKNYQMYEFIRVVDNGYIVEFNNSIEGKVKVEIEDLLANKHALRFEEEVRLLLK